MQKFKDFHKQLDEGIFKSVTSEEADERENEYAERYQKMVNGIESWNVFDFIEPDTYDIKNLLSGKDDNDKLFEKVYDHASGMASDMQVDAGVTLQDDMFYELIGEIEQRADYSIFGINKIYENYLFIVERPFIVRKYDDAEKVDEELDGIYTHVINLGFTREQVKQVYDRSLYGGEVKIGIISELKKPDKNKMMVIEGYPLLAVGDSYVIGNVHQYVIKDKETAGKMLDIELGEATHTKDWTWE